MALTSHRVFAFEIARRGKLSRQEEVSSMSPSLGSVRKSRLVCIFQESREEKSIEFSKRSQRRDAKGSKRYVKIDVEDPGKFPSVELSKDA